MFQKSHFTLGLSFVASTLLATTLFASNISPNQELYEVGLKNVETGHFGPLANVRSVGGLKCILTHADKSYTCKLDKENADHAAIFEALNAQEVSTEQESKILGGPKTSNKSVGGFTCKKSVYADYRRKPEYACFFTRRGLNLDERLKDSVNDSHQKPNSLPSSSTDGPNPLPSPRFDNNGAGKLD